MTHKMFLKMGEVCDLTGLESHVIRFWETEFPQLTPKKNRSGHRIFTHADVALIRHIKTLVHEQGFTISGAIKKLDETQNHAAVPDVPELKQKEMLAQVQEVSAILKNLTKMLDEA
jgi:DNA-binding transcriptional MerR regulator